MKKSLWNLLKNISNCTFYNSIFDFQYYDWVKHFRWHCRRTSTKNKLLLLLSKTVHRSNRPIRADSTIHLRHLPETRSSFPRFGKNYEITTNNNQNNTTQTYNKKQYPLFLTGKSCPEQPDNAANVFHRQGCNSQRRKQYHTLVQPSLYLHRQSLPQQLWQPSYYQK